MLRSCGAVIFVKMSGEPVDWDATTGLMWWRRWECEDARWIFEVRVEADGRWHKRSKPDDDALPPPRQKPLLPALHVSTTISKHLLTTSTWPF